MTKDPVDGAVTVVRRSIDVLGTMQRNGTITSEMRAAGDIFREHFRCAAMDGMGTSKILRVARSSGDSLTDGVVRAREAVHEALAALGGMTSAAGSCAWFVLGLEASIREWASRWGWNGRSIHHVHAQGILIACLGVLAGHYGLVEVRRRVVASLDGRTPHLVAGEHAHE